jgi:hypothetical protein
MTPVEGILIAVDDSKASEKAVAYVGRLVSKCTGIHLCLLHVLPAIPPGYLESGGPANTSEGMLECQRLERVRDRWVQELRDNSQPLFDKLCGILTEAGVPGRLICTCFYAPHPGETVAEGILGSPCGEGFGTIALGRETFPWYLELFHHHVSDEVERRGRGRTIWIVE